MYYSFTLLTSYSHNAHLIKCPKELACVQRSRTQQANVHPLSSSCLLTQPQQDKPVHR